MTIIKSTETQTKNDTSLTFDNWGFIYNSNEKLGRLANLALKERWYYGNQNPGNFPLLRNYLYFTFKRLEHEQKIMESEKYAAFDTGLVDIKYDSIYAIFKRTKEKNGKKPEHKWILHDFSSASHRYNGRILLDNFHPLPKRAVYFSDINEVIFDTRHGNIQLSDDHIIIDNINRFPIEFIRRNLSYRVRQPNEDELKNKNGIEKYYKYLRKELLEEENLTSIKNMRNRLLDAIEVAVKRTIWNFKTAIPMYYIKFKKVSLLLPLSLVRDEIVDIALVVEKMKSGAYRGNSILPLKLAYMNARLLTRPDSDWLVAEGNKFNHKRIDTNPKKQEQL